MSTGDLRSLGAIRENGGGIGGIGGADSDASGSGGGYGGLGGGGRGGNEEPIAECEEEVLGETDALEYYNRKKSGRVGRSKGLRLRPDEAKRKDCIVAKKDAQRKGQKVGNSAKHGVTKKKKGGRGGGGGGSE